MAFGISGFQQPSVMRHDFSMVPKAEIERSSFKRSHGYKTTFDSGYLIPVYADEVLPGDTFKVNMSSVCRMCTPYYPIMDNMYMDFFFFFVPNRLLWDNFQKFMGEQKNPGDSTDFRVPQIDMGEFGVESNSLADYFGIPTGVVGIKFNSLHFRAYNLIWNEWFRDQNLQDSVVVDLDDGPDSLVDYGLLKRGKRHDYFTSCLPWPQKGVAVELPLGATAPVIGNGKTIGLTNAYPSTSGSRFGLQNSSSTNALRVAATNYGQNVGSTVGTVDSTAKTLGLTDQPESSGLIADLSTATAATINELRQAFQLQRLMERDARGGTRYTEIVRSHFGVISPDARLQRPEYLGGGSKRINVDPVPNTASGVAPGYFVGQLGAAVYSNQSGIGFTKSFVEHGVIIGMVCVRADLTYQQGMNKMWARQTRYDYYMPALAHIGEQAVLNYEIYTAGDEHDNDVFGYQERWAEYRYKPSLITGTFRSTHSASLDAWHLSQEFEARPVLDETFIQENPPLKRVEAVSGQPDFLFDAFFDVTTTRPMPTYSVPGMIDHF